jgi:hypothetical protein
MPARTNVPPEPTVQEQLDSLKGQVRKLFANGSDSGDQIGVLGERVLAIAKRTSAVETWCGNLAKELTAIGGVVQTLTETPTEHADAITVLQKRATAAYERADQHAADLEVSHRRLTRLERALDHRPAPITAALRFILDRIPVGW